MVLLVNVEVKNGKIFILTKVPGEEVQRSLSYQIRSGFKNYTKNTCG